MDSFSDRLAAAVRRTGNGVCVGLDPRVEQLPECLLRRPSGGQPPLTDVLAAYRKFCEGVIDAVRDLVPIVKPQVAFFEQLGAQGISLLDSIVSYARDAGLLVIIDGKRNDIGTTAEAYADGWLGADSPRRWSGDALTVSPYLGHDSLTPFVEVANRRGAGLFVLVKTSNPGGGQFQDLIAEGRPLYRHVAEYVETLAATEAGTCGYGSVGAVVGATYPEQLSELRAAMPHAWLLVPGYGAQGGKAEDVARGFDAKGLGAIVNNSRGIIFAHARKPYAEKFGDSRWQDAVAAATRDMIAELQAHVTVSP